MRTTGMLAIAVACVMAGAEAVLRHAEAGVIAVGKP
jgi:hypothetical protein